MAKKDYYNISKKYIKTEVTEEEQYNKLGEAVNRRIHVMQEGHKILDKIKRFFRKVRLF